MTMFPAMVLGGLLGAVAGVLLLLCVCCLCRRHAKQKPQVYGGIIHPTLIPGFLKKPSPIQPLSSAKLPPVPAPLDTLTGVQPPTQPGHRPDPLVNTPLPGSDGVLEDTDCFEEKNFSSQKEQRTVPSTQLEQHKFINDCIRKSKGKLHFALQYNADCSELKIVVMEASGLPKTDKMGFCDPFVVMSLHTRALCRKAETSIKTQTLSPTWNESFSFNLTSTEIAEGSLILSLFDCDKFSRCNFIGDVRFRLADVNLTSGHSTWWQLTAPEKGGNVDMGELLFAIGYLPTANRLVVVIMKARNLCSKMLKDCADLSVKLTLWHQSTRLKKKQTKRVRCKLSPVWNEVIMFEVPLDHLGSVALELILVSFEQAGQASAVGRCSVSARASGLGAKHWQEMVSNPRKQIAMWHAVS
uniref:Synaptotagmin XIII n=1 Tax=Eptatretus burgeri TaxID=7764 RepID=A0A8C4QQQ0_EPTBU